MADNFEKYTAGLDSPASDGLAVTPHDSTDLTTHGCALYVGVSGNVVLVTSSGTVLTFVGVLAGSILPVRVQRVNATLTTATDMIALF